MSDGPIWWPSVPEDDDKPKIDIDEMWNEMTSYPVLIDDCLDKVFSPENQPNDFVQVGVKDCTTRSWLISDKSIPLHDDDSRVIYDNTEDFV